MSEPVSQQTPNETAEPALREYHNPQTGYKWHTRDVWVSLPHNAGKEVKTVKVIEHPGVYLVAAMSLQPDSVNDFLKDHQIKTFRPWEEDAHGAPNHVNNRNDRGTDHELLTELSGRVCYMSYDRPRPGGVESFLKNLKSEGHGSVFEHPHYSFLLTGVSRNLTLEGNRHRPFSISQLSGRFVDASEVGFVCDPDLPRTELDEWASKCRAAFDSYESQYRSNYARQLEKWQSENRSEKMPLGDLRPSKQDERKIIKKARERARDILPGCLETRIMYTVNARAIRFVFEKRCHADAAFEIRRAFNGVYLALKRHDPKLFDDYTERPLPDGTFAVETPFLKI